MREIEVEKYLTQSVQKLGGLCYKFTSPGTAGVPDRLILLKGKAAFAELKRPVGGRLSEIQKFRIKQLRNAGFKVEVLSNKKEVDDFVSKLF